MIKCLSLKFIYIRKGDREIILKENDNYDGRRNERYPRI